MTQVLIIIHVVVCIAMIMIVLLQTGKGADMGAAFGGGASQTLFGSGGASTFLTKLTTVAAVVFMITSLALAYYSTNRAKSSIMLDTQAPITEQATPQGLPSEPANPADQSATPSAEEPAPADEEKSQ
jgi:preprotein translocase subunit SecG